MWVLFGGAESPHWPSVTWVWLIISDGKPKLPSIRLTYAPRQIRLWGFNEEIIVMVHQAVGVTEPLLTLDHMSLQGEQMWAHSLIADDVLARIAPTFGMVEGAGEFKRTRRVLERAWGPMRACKT